MPYLRAKSLKQAALRKQKRTIGVSPDGNEVRIDSIPQFCRLMKFNPNAVRQCARGERAEYKGWKFYYKGERDDRIPRKPKETKAADPKETGQNPTKV
jgi:hypothetical protein